MSDETRLYLMDLFRRDMTGIEPTRACHDDDPHPAFKMHPAVFKYEQSTYLFKIWMAGRANVAAEAEGLREQLAKQGDDYCKRIDEMIELQAKLDTAMGLLSRAVVHVPVYAMKVLSDCQAFINTTSTEGKDHD